MEARSLPLAALISLLTRVGRQGDEVIVPGYLALSFVRRASKDQFVFAGLQCARRYHQGYESSPIGLLGGQSFLNPHLSAAGCSEFDAIATVVDGRIKLEL